MIKLAFPVLGPHSYEKVPIAQYAGETDISRKQHLQWQSKENHSHQQEESTGHLFYSSTIYQPPPLHSAATTVNQYSSSFVPSPQA
jgi:hypothetical protein